jgi:ketosteroid isomerase-like protein
MVETTVGANLDPSDWNAAARQASLELGRAWIAALNRRDLATLKTQLTDDFLYSAMARTPKDLAIRWDRDTFLGFAAQGGGMKQPVEMTIVGETTTGDQVVIETEGYGVRDTGYVYANIYCFIFWIRDGKISAVHDYCCTHTAVLHIEHIKETMAAAG